MGKPETNNEVGMTRADEARGIARRERMRSERGSDAEMYTRVRIWSGRRGCRVRLMGMMSLRLSAASSGERMPGPGVVISRSRSLLPMKK